MDNQLIVTLVGATVSGVFSLITALIPYYIQRKKSKTDFVQEIADRSFYASWPWYFAFGAFFITFIGFVIAALQTLGMIYGLMIAAEQTGDIAAFFSNFDLHKSRSMMTFFINVGNNITSVIHAVTFFFIATYCGHRFGKLIFIKMLLMLTVDSVIACGIAFYYRDSFFTSNTDILVLSRYYIDYKPSMFNVLIES
ncbi:MAG: hypothetical protein J7K30_07885 [Deltaproteobacteria bacterium]|nr:hypothetical protein [Deltaproteobacteria bacterium]